MLNKKKLFIAEGRALRCLILMAVSSVIIYFVLSVRAGSLNPSLPVASTMRSMDEIYSVLFGLHDSSSVSSKSDGNVLENLKCITNKMNNGTCN